MYLLRRLSVLTFILLAVPLYAQQNDRDSSSLVDAVSTFLGFNQPKLGFMSQLAVEVSDNESDTRSEFTLRNLRFYFTGKAGDKFSYYFQGNINGKYEFLDLRLSYQLSKVFRIDGGRLKTPFGIEYLRNDARLMFVHRSMTALNIGPLRQYGAQLQTYLFNKRIHLTTGVFNGGIEETPKISLAVGRINTIPIQGNIGGSNLQIELGGSAAYTGREADFPNYIFIEKNHLLYGLHSRMTYGSLWLEGEYDAASSDNKKTLEGFYCDLGYRFGEKLEAAARLDWMERYSVLYSSIMSKDVIRKYIVGANWYPIDNIKVQFNFEREEGITNIHTGYINVQYAINYE
jgi:Phosphate-selective porin O and P